MLITLSSVLFQQELVWPRSVEYLFASNVVVVVYPKVPISVSWCVLEEVFTFPLDVRILNNSFKFSSVETVYLWSNMAEAEIYYSINTAECNTLYTDLILSESCTLYYKAVLNGLSTVVCSQFFELVNLAEYAYFTLTKECLKQRIDFFTQLTVLSPYLAIKGSTHKTTFTYDGLKDVAYKNTYTQYKNYILENNVCALFADEAMTQPFPFISRLSISPGDYFTLPDKYAAVYLNGSKKYGYTEENLVCQFNDEFRSNSELTIASDYCLRLIVDSLVERDYVDVKVWTNIPAGTFLLSDNDSVKLSLDGLNYGSSIRLMSSQLFIRGSIGTNSPSELNISISMYNCEVINGPDI